MSSVTALLSVFTVEPWEIPENMFADCTNLPSHTPWLGGQWLGRPCAAREMSHGPRVLSLSQSLNRMLRRPCNPNCTSQEQRLWPGHLDSPGLSPHLGDRGRALSHKDVRGLSGKGQSYPSSTQCSGCTTLSSKYLIQIHDFNPHRHPGARFCHLPLFQRKTWRHRAEVTPPRPHRS